MKKYRALIPLVLVVLMVVSWYTLVSEAVTQTTEYEQHLTEARRLAKDGAMKYAVAEYNLALEIQSSPEIYVEVADHYRALGKTTDHLTWCRNFFEVYPTEPAAYDCLLSSYMDSKDYQSCYDVLETAGKRGITTEYLDKVRAELMYVWDLDFNTYDDVGIYSNNYCAVNKKGAWGFVDRYGRLRVKCNYPQVGAYTQSNYVSVVNADGEPYFIDKSGERVMAAQTPYLQFGLLVNDKLTAQKTDGSYVYLDKTFTELFGAYTYASTINNGVGAVQTNGVWKLIDSSGNQIGTDTYTDVKLDEKQIAFRNDRLFVSTGSGGYVMVDGTGAQVGSLRFEDAKVFGSTDPAAVKINGKWCFINANGALVSDKTYDDARSFVSGLAAVKTNGKWGFVDLEENMVIEPQFFDAKDMNEKGSCFVNTGDSWQLLKLYRLNREG